MQNSVCTYVCVYIYVYIYIYKIDGRDMALDYHAKLLGVTISQDLTWNKHVENSVKRLVNDCTCYIS